MGPKCTSQGCLEMQCWPQSHGYLPTSASWHLKLEAISFLLMLPEPMKAGVASSGLKVAVWHKNQLWV